MSKQEKQSSEGGANSNEMPCIPEGAKPLDKQCLSNELADLFNVKTTTKMTRGQVIKNIWSYIHEHNLQDPNDATYIIPDEKLAAVFGKERFVGFTMATNLEKHYKRQNLSAFAKACQSEGLAPLDKQCLSHELASLINDDEDVKMTRGQIVKRFETRGQIVKRFETRGQIVKRIWNYIDGIDHIEGLDHARKELERFGQNVQEKFEKDDATYIIPDEKMAAVFGKERFVGFATNLEKHYNEKMAAVVGKERFVGFTMATNREKNYKRQNGSAFAKECQLDKQCLSHELASLINDDEDVKKTGGQIVKRIWNYIEGIAHIEGLARMYKKSLKKKND